MRARCSYCAPRCCQQYRSEEHMSELQSRLHLVCRLLLEKKKNDLWCGPTSKDPIMRRQLHYEWHWFWATGNGEMGNNGPHVIDLCRWALGQNQAPARALSIGCR